MSGPVETRSALSWLLPQVRRAPLDTPIALTMEGNMCGSVGMPVASSSMLGVATAAIAGVTHAMAGTLQGLEMRGRRHSLGGTAMTRAADTAFFVGDCFAGAITGAVTALAVRVVVPEQGEMVTAMLLGMVAGILVHLGLGLLLLPLLGMFETMVPGMYIGMYGGMLFGMRDAMQREMVTIGDAVAVGAAFGVIVVVGVHFWNVQLRRVEAGVIRHGDESKMGSSE